MGTKVDSFTRRAARVAAIYLVFGTAWILLSDKVVDLWAPNAETVIWLQSVKGIAYIVTTGILVLLATRQVLVEQYTLSRKADHNERRFVAMFDLAGVGIGLLKPDGRWLRANPKLCNMLGYSETELLGKTYVEITHPDDVARSRAHFDDAAFGSHFSHAIEKRYFRKDGSVLWVMATVSPAIARDSDSGEVEYLIAVEEDISDRKRVEEERDRIETEFLQAQKMEAVGRLAGGIAHDFNNMLGVIMGYSETAMHELGPEHPVYADLKEVLVAAERSAALTRQLLAFARKEVIAPKNTDLNVAITDCEKMLLRLLGSNIQINLALSDDLWNLYMDPSQIDQVLMNLAVNSRDAIRGSGAIWISTACITIKDPISDGTLQAPPGDYVCLGFKDNGCGMDATTRARAFEPFFTTKPLGQGTGLGLATVYGIVKQNRGFLELESSPGEGTSFKIYFRRNDSGVADLEREPTEIHGGTETIVLVEDEPQILELCKRVLITRGYNVLAFDNPQRAIETIQRYSGKVDLLVTDFIMPEMDGATLATAMWQLLPGLPVICVSGHAASALGGIEGLPPGTRYLQKPVSPTALLREIWEVLHSASS